MITSRIDCSTLECRAYVKLGAWKWKKNELFPYLIKTMSFFLIISSSYFALSSLEMKMKKIMENDTLDNSNIIEVLEIICVWWILKGHLLLLVRWTNYLEMTIIIEMVHLDQS